VFQMGVYMYSNLATVGSFYHRMGGRYLVYKNFFGTVILKTHFAKADFLEVGVGWMLLRNTNRSEIRN